MDPGLRAKLEPVLVSLITPPGPLPVAPPPAPPPAPEPKPKAPQPKVAPRAPPPPAPAPAAAPSPDAITVERPAASAEAPATPAAPSQPAPAAAAGPAAPAVATAPPAALTPPRFDAAYLNNPRPEYPRVARRMGEEGKVVLRVFVGPAGGAEKVEVRTSSGFPRLDEAAREAVEKWKFVPARRGEEAVGAWVLVPITFALGG